MDPETIELIRVVVSEASAPSVLVAVISSIANVCLAVTAIAALFYASHQVTVARRANQTARQNLASMAVANEANARIAKGQFLFLLDQMYEGPEMHECRRAFLKERETIKNKVDADLPHAQDGERKDAIAEEFSKRLFELKKSDLECYLKIMKLCGFFESLGLLCKLSYAEYNEVLDLYSVSIVHAATSVSRHLRHRQERDHGTGKLYMENFLILADKADDYVNARKH